MNNQRMRILNFVILSLTILISSCTNSNVNSEMEATDTLNTINPAPAEEVSKTNANTPIANTVPPQIESKILDTIFSFPEMKELDKYIRKETKGERNLKVWIASTPEDNNEGYYLVNAGEDNGTNYVRHHSFYLNPKTMEIRYSDVVNDKLITLEEWRRTNKQVLD